MGKEFQVVEKQLCLKVETLREQRDHIRGLLVKLINGVADKEGLERVQNSKEVPHETYQQKVEEILAKMSSSRSNPELEQILALLRRDFN